MMGKVGMSGFSGGEISKNRTGTGKHRERVRTGEHVRLRKSRSNQMEAEISVTKLQDKSQKNSRVTEYPKWKQVGLLQWMMLELG